MIKFILLQNKSHALPTKAQIPSWEKKVGVFAKTSSIQKYCADCHYPESLAYDPETGKFSATEKDFVHAYFSSKNSAHSHCLRYARRKFVRMKQTVDLARVDFPKNILFNFK